MKCPACEKVLKVPDGVLSNVSEYRNTVISVTECCGQFISITGEETFHVSKYTGEDIEDAWGRKRKVMIEEKPIFNEEPLSLITTIMKKGRDIGYCLSESDAHDILLSIRTYKKPEVIETRSKQPVIRDTPAIQPQIVDAMFDMIKWAQIEEDERMGELEMRHWMKKKYC